MAFLPSLSSADIQHYHRVVTRSAEVRSHFDLLLWLQGDVQRYLPHHIMVAAWGNFQDSQIQYDVLSPLPGVRSHTTRPQVAQPLLKRLFFRWSEFGRKPFVLNVGKDGFVLPSDAQLCPLGRSLQQMRSAMVHGITDARGNLDCLYIAFGMHVPYGDNESSAMAAVLPYIDIALRQVDHLPNQTFPTAPLTESAPPVAAALPESLPLQQWGLTSREAEIVSWVAMGKTNPDIGLILGISAFTVKNHLQRIFKKLDVSNRAQAVGKLHTLLVDV
ncbi:MAG: XrtB/PEP-CTERM-associated transcriptional regulator EpsA [Burkholderiales bacterium]